jgi:ribosome recycling factor
MNLSVPVWLVGEKKANDIIRNVEEKMQKSAEGLKKELSTIRTGRASVSLVEHVKVDYSGVSTPLIQLAGISAPEVSLLVIQPWDKTTIRMIEKAILASDLGLTPINDGNVIRIKIPPLSEERRQELTKVVKKRVEERKVAIRNLRHEALGELKEIEKKKEISQDELKRLTNQLQKSTDVSIIAAEQIGQDKEVELSRV